MTPNEYYRSARPDKFSDSIVKREAKLTRELMELEMSRLATNEKHNNFERLCVKLAEKYITPNLIPQVGPAAGGDGKTDSETYPVDNKISNKWYVPKGGAVNGEKWAFAISTMEKWKTKVRRDVASIEGTGREYTQIYFMSSQKISSKQQKETQDKLRKEFNSNVTIIDETWIIDKVIEGKLQTTFARTLEMSDVYIAETITKGPNDIQRENEVEQLEERICDPERYLEFDIQRIEDALDVAMISRGLEKGKSDIDGKFDRAIRFAEALESHKYLLKIYYNYFNTCLYFFDDIIGAVSSYKEFKKSYSKIDPTIQDLEYKQTLIQLLEIVKEKHEHITTDALNEIDIEGDILSLIDDYQLFINNKEKPTSGNIATIFYQLRLLRDNIDDTKKVNKCLNEIQKCFITTEDYLDFPFVKMVEYVTVFGRLFPDSQKYDELTNVIADIDGNKSGDLRKGERYLDRANEKINGKNTVSALSFFGKAFIGLAKGQNERGLLSCLMGLSHCYALLGLYFAAINCSYMALSQKLGKFYQSRYINPRIPDIIETIMRYEIMVGRIPNTLMLLELYKVMAAQLNIAKDKYDEVIQLVDSSVSIRLYQDNYRNGISEYLPILFDNQDMNNSCLMGYYLLNQEKSLGISDSDWKSFISDTHNQPLRNLYKDKALFFERTTSSLSSNIAGCVIVVKFDNESNSVVAAETLLAILEILFATRASEIAPIHESIKYTITWKDNLSSVKYIDSTKSAINVNLIKTQDIKEQFENLFPEILATFIEDKFLSDKGIEFILEDLAVNEDIFSRLSTAYLQSRFNNEIFGDNPKRSIWDWVDKTKGGDLELIGSPRVIDALVDDEPSIDFNNLENLRHDQREVLPFIDDSLWEKATHSGMGYAFQGPNSCLFLAFEDELLGRSIFEDMINRYGTNQTEEGVRLSLLKGVDDQNPYFYRLVLSPKNLVKPGKIYVYKTRAKTMTPNDHSNFDKIAMYATDNDHAYVCPATMNRDMKVEIHFDLMIKFGKIDLIEAWALTNQDPEVIGLRNDETPVVPDGISDPPYLKLRKRN